MYFWVYALLLVQAGVSFEHAVDVMHVEHQPVLYKSENAERKTFILDSHFVMQVKMNSFYFVAFWKEIKVMECADICLF